MPMSEPIRGWCIQCGKEHGGFYCPQDPNPPKNAAYWKRRAKKAEETLAEREAWFEKCIAMWKQEEVMWKERETELLATLNMKWSPKP